jgi:hypothetical protein
MAPSRADSLLHADSDDEKDEKRVDNSASNSAAGWRAPRTYDSDDEDDNPAVAQPKQQVDAGVKGETQDTGLMTNAERHSERSENATVVFAIPLPEVPFGLPEKQAANVPPFVLYALPPAPLKAPVEGQKEGLVNKAQRHWQEKERDARKDETTIKNKASAYYAAIQLMLL